MLMPGLIKDRPENLNEIGTYKITVYTVFFHKENIAYETTYTGKKWIAYLKVRWAALKKDLMTEGNYYGIAWGLKELNNNES